MSVITRDQLSQLIPKNPYLDQWCEALNEILPEYGIDTPQRVAAFIAQCAHESRRVSCISQRKFKLSCRNTAQDCFPSIFLTDALARAYAHANKQEAIANRSVCQSHGQRRRTFRRRFRYCGRGLIQLTGRDNYTFFAGSLDIPVEEASEYSADL
jgi:putative chitinase